MTLLWQAKSLADFTRLELVRAAQAQDLGNGIFRAEVKFGDKMPEYSDQRSLWDISQPECQFREGDECAFAFGAMLPADWIGWFPKADELGNWPGTPNVGTGQGGVTGGSLAEFHHAPLDGNWANLWPPSAPFYFGANADYWRGSFLETDPASPNFGGLRAAGTWNLKPIVRGQWVEFAIHAVWSLDPANGYLEVYCDGQRAARLQSATLYPGTFVYPQMGLYRRVYIGDPSLSWIADARPGVSYPARFVPKMGARVFPDPGGYPQSVQFRNPRIGKTLEDVMATAPTPAPTPAPAAPQWLWKDVRGGLDAQVAAAQAEVDAATQRRDALAKVRDLLAAQLNKGDAWLAP